MKSSIRISPGWTGAHLSVVIDEFNIFYPSVFPDKAEPPLAIDTDAVLTFASLQSVTWRHSSRVQCRSCIQQFEFSDGSLLHSGINRSHPLTMPATFRIPGGKRFDHASIALSL